MIFYWILALALHREAKNKGSYLDWVWQVWRVSCIWCPAVNVTFSSCLVTQFGRWNPSERVSKLRLKAVTMVTLSVEKMRVKVARLPSKIMQFFFYFSGKALPHRCGVNRTVGLLQYIQSYTHTHTGTAVMMSTGPLLKVREKKMSDNCIYLFLLRRQLRHSLCLYGVWTVFMRWPEVLSSPWPDVYGVKSCLHLVSLLFSWSLTGLKAKPCLFFLSFFLPETVFLLFLSFMGAITRSILDLFSF